MNPRIAVVGLSPASTQMKVFARSYSGRGDYGLASVEAAFSGGLDGDIIRMMDGLGLTPKLGVRLHGMSFAQHSEVWVTSVVACATLKDGTDSASWDPPRHEAARRCIAERLVPELLNPAWTRLQAILVLGNNAWQALEKVVMPGGSTALKALQTGGKLVLRMPHPSGSNRELVSLASMNARDFPTKEVFVGRKLSEYLANPVEKRKQGEAEYRRKRETAWTNVDALRKQIDGLAPARG